MYREIKQKGEIRIKKSSLERLKRHKLYFTIFELHSIQNDSSFVRSYKMESNYQNNQIKQQQLNDEKELKRYESDKNLRCVMRYFINFGMQLLNINDKSR